MTIAIIQARMGSSRLPGKVLMPIGKKAAIQHVVDRAHRCKSVDRVVLATSVHEKDDPLAEYCAQHNIPCFRGSEDDVLDRYYQAALHTEAEAGDIIIRITGDCPFLDPEVCERVIALASLPETDYASNTIEETFPDGLDCEAFSFETLERMHRDATLMFEREHVTQHAKRNTDKFRLRGLKSSFDYHDQRWTLDEPEDYAFICQVYEGLGRDDYTMNDVLVFLSENPNILHINQGFIRNEGLIKSIERERRL